MKFAEISPGHKKDDNLIRGNYRPVSVLPILSKVYETVMNDQLFGYFLDKFHEFLSAFRKRYSCQSLLLKAVDDWKYALDQNLKTGVVFMDLSMTTQCHIRHRPCRAFCQVYSMTAKSPLSGLVIMEWRRTLQNSNLWYCHQTRLMTSNWNWMRIPYLNLKNQSRPWESS